MRINWPGLAVLIAVASIPFSRLDHCRLYSPLRLLSYRLACEGHITARGNEAFRLSGLGPLG